MKVSNFTETDFTGAAFAAKKTWRQNVIDE